jgi:hypothetical protein
MSTKREDDKLSHGALFTTNSVDPPGVDKPGCRPPGGDKLTGRQVDKSQLSTSLDQNKRCRPPWDDKLRDRQFVDQNKRSKFSEFSIASCRPPRTIVNLPRSKQKKKIGIFDPKRPAVLVRGGGRKDRDFRSPAVALKRQTGRQVDKFQLSTSLDQNKRSRFSINSPTRATPGCRPRGDRLSDRQFADQNKRKRSRFSIEKRGRQGRQKGDKGALSDQQFADQNKRSRLSIAFKRSRFSIANLRPQGSK